MAIPGFNIRPQPMYPSPVKSRSRPKRKPKRPEDPGPYWDTPVGRLYARDGWMDWGGGLMLAVGKTEGGAPFGLTYEEWVRLEEADARRTAAMKERKTGDYHHLEVDLEELGMALESWWVEGSHLVDLNTGEVVLLPDYDPAPEQKELCAAVEANPERYVPILPDEHWRAIQIMEDFVEGLPEGRVRKDLEWALSRKRKPFRHFKDALLAHPEARERWFAYHDGRLREIALAWLADEVPGARGK